MSFLSTHDAYVLWSARLGIPISNTTVLKYGKFTAIFEDISAFH